MRRLVSPDSSDIRKATMRSRMGDDVASSDVIHRALRLLAWLGLVLVALICILPVVITILGSVSEGNPFNDFHGSLDPWRRAADSSQTLRSIGFSFLLCL